MADPFSEDQFQQWLSPDLFSASQGTPVSSGIIGLEQTSPLHDRYAGADHASLQPRTANYAPHVATNQETENIVPYDVVWKVTNEKNKGVKDTMEGVKEHPALLWTNTLQPALNDVLETHGLKDELPVNTAVIALASGRGGGRYERSFQGLQIDWDRMYEKLASWADPRCSSRKLKLEISFNFKVHKGVKTSARNQTERQLAELTEHLGSEQASSGNVYPWTKSYEFYKCSEPKCKIKAKGWYCWRDADGTHYELLSQDLAELAREGLRSHSVPEQMRRKFRTRKVGYSPRKARSGSQARLSPRAPRLISMTSPTRSESCRASTTPQSRIYHPAVRNTPTYFQGEDPKKDLQKFFEKLREGALDSSWQADYDEAKAFALHHKLHVALIAALGMDFYAKADISVGTAHRVVEGAKYWIQSRDT